MSRIFGVVAGAVALVGSWAAQAQVPGWSAELITKGTPMCVLSAGDARSDLLFMVKVAQGNIARAGLLIARLDKKPWPASFKARLTIDGRDAWSVPFMQDAKLSEAAWSSASGKDLLSFLDDIAAGNRMSLVYENGFAQQFSLAGSAQAVRSFAQCVVALKGTEPPTEKEPPTTPSRDTNV